MDIGDNFIALWISFNAWMKSKFGEGATDSAMIDSVSRLDDFKTTFSQLKAQADFRNKLAELEGFTVVDMRDQDNRTKFKEYIGTFESLMSILYLIRCNLFHGRKNIDDDKNDLKLVCLAYYILLPLFKKHIGYQS